jgi:hypothetical protein
MIEIFTTDTRTLALPHSPPQQPQNCQTEGPQQSAHSSRHGDKQHNDLPRSERIEN